MVPRGPTERGRVGSAGIGAEDAEADLVLRPDAVGEVLGRGAVERERATGRSDAGR